jgi:Na+/H+-dicarboxylate symporter
MKLWMKILIGLGLGAAVGLLVGPDAVYLKPIGQIFISLINMIIVLLILSSMTVGITAIHDPKKLGRVGIKTLILYLTTTAVAIVIGIGFAKIFEPGTSLPLRLPEPIGIIQTPSITEMLYSIVPSNPIQALAEGNVLQIIVFSVFLGLAINFAGERGKPLLKVLDSLAEVMYRLTSIVMEFSPIGVFAIMAWVAGTFGSAVLLPLLKFLALYYFACFVHIVIVFLPMLKWMAKVNPIDFFKGMKEAIIMAFSTCSSSATLPISMKCAEENLGISKNITSFVLPLGSTINMNGAALYQGMAAVFIAQAYGLELNLFALTTLVITAILSSIGAAGIPGSGFIMLSVVFTSVGIPIEGLALLAGIDRVREMISTVLNILGDAVCAMVVAKQEAKRPETIELANA